MCIEDTEKYHKIQEELKTMMSKCEICSGEIMECIDRLMQTAHIRTEDICTKCTNLISTTEIFLKRETENMLGKIDVMESTVNECAFMLAKQHATILFLAEQNSTLQAQLKCEKNGLEANLAEAHGKLNESLGLCLKLQQQGSEQQEIIIELKQCLFDANRENEMNTRRMKVEKFFFVALLCCFPEALSSGNGLANRAFNRAFGS